MIEAEDYRAAAKQFFSQNPVVDDRQITVETAGWLSFGAEQFSSSDFLDDAARESILSGAAPPPSPEPQSSIPLLPILFRILAALEFIGGLVLCNSLWPPYGGRGFSDAYIPAVTWLMAGIISGALFLAIAEMLTYLCQIRDLLKRERT